MSEFLSTPSAGRATAIASPKMLEQFYFYPRPPRGGRQGVVRQDASHLSISIHALRGEGDADY